MKRILSLILCLILVSLLPGMSLAETALQAAYDEAMEYVLKEDYATAIEKFEALGIYSDAMHMVDYCKGCQYAQEENYDMAMFHMNKAQVKDSGYLHTYYNGLKFEKMADEIDLEHVSQNYIDLALFYYQYAYTNFSSLDIFKDSWDHAEKCADIYNRYAPDNQQLIPNKLKLYNQGQELLENGRLEEAKEIFYNLRGYMYATEHYTMIIHDNAMKLLEEGKKAEAFQEFSKVLNTRTSTEKVNVLRQHFTDMVQINDMCTVGLKEDGTVLFTGSSSYGLPEAAKWTDIEKLRAVGCIIVGLKKDGTVVAVGNNNYGQCDVQDWTDIVDIAVNDDHVIGLKKDGTVVAAGNNQNGQCDVQDWTDITAVATNDFHTLGIKADGTVVAVGVNDDRQCDVDQIINLEEYYVNRADQIILGRDHSIIVTDDHIAHAIGSNAYGQLGINGLSLCAQVISGDYCSMALRADNTVDAWGYNDYRQCNVGGWRDIMHISTSQDHTAAVTLDGTAMAIGYNAYGQCDVEEWTDLICIWAGSYVTVGLKTDGTLVAVGNNNYGQLDIQGWKLW